MAYPPTHRFIHVAFNFRATVKPIADLACDSTFMEFISTGTYTSSEVTRGWLPNCRPGINFPVLLTPPCGALRYLGGTSAALTAFAPPVCCRRPTLRPAPCHTSWLAISSCP